MHLITNRQVKVMSHNYHARKVSLRLHFPHTYSPLNVAVSRLNRHWVEEQVMCRLVRALQSTTEKQKHVGLPVTYIPISCEISERTVRVFKAGSTIWQIVTENNRNSVQCIQNLTSAFPCTVKCFFKLRLSTISCVHNINIRVCYFNAVSLYVFFYCIPLNTNIMWHSSLCVDIV